MNGLWRCDRLEAEQPLRVTTTWHATKAGADAKAADAGSRTLVWFDAFDYERHNPGESAARYAARVAAERATGLDFVRALAAALRSRLGLGEAA